MIKTGKVKKYQEERGFGFIALDDGGKDIFFHIKDFPNKKVLPKIGEKLTFSIGQDGQKIKAINIIRLDFPNQPEKNHVIPERIVSRSNRQRNKHKSESTDIFSLIITAVVIGVIGYFVYGSIKDSLHRSELANQPVTIETLHIANQQVDSNPNNYKCDGRVYCTHMNSREEANWFVRNCSGTKMDSDNDGEACENDSRW